MDRYPTVAEVTDAARRLVSRYPETGRLRRIGTSRAGRPILMLSLGHGPRHLLVVAGPHPDEPVSGATALALAEQVAERAEHAERTSAATDLDAVTWDIVLCLDPDGAALSEYAAEGATGTAGHTLPRYYRTTFRPVAAEQPEWAPIVTRPLPESRTLFQVIEELRPVLQCSLHSVDAGGTFVQLTSELPGLAAPFRLSAAAHAIPVQHGTYDALYWRNPDPGIWVLPEPESTDRLAPGSENFALSTWCAPQRYGGVTAIVEIPMWASDLTEDLSPHPEPAHALRDLSDLVLDGGRQVTALLDQARAFFPAGDNPRTRVLEWMADNLYSLVAASWEPLARQAASPSYADGPDRLTVAQIAALDIVARRQPLRAAGLLLRSLETADDATAPSLRDALSELLTTWCTDFEKALQLRWVPVHDQVRHQARTVMAAAETTLSNSLPTPGTDTAP